MSVNHLTLMRPLSELFFPRPQPRPEQGPQLRPPTLGRLEADVLRILWSKGESSVRDVLLCLDRPLAYTTVMTTLDRLFKKGLLDRQMIERSFRYIPRVPTRPAGSAKKTSTRAVSQSTRDLLVSHLVDTVCEYDETLLDELERDIANRRLQMKQLKAVESSRGTGQ
jgi:predicted transcriptional regulator